MIAQITNGIGSITNFPDSTAQDIQKVFQDFHVGVSVSSIMLFLVAVKAAAGYYRNWALKNVTAEQANPISRAIAHVAGNSLPSQPIVQATGQAVVPTTPAEATIPTK